MTTAQAEVILRGIKYRELRGNPTVASKLTGAKSLRQAKQVFGEAKATLARENPAALRAIGRFPPGAGEVTAAHRRDPRSKRQRPPK